MSTQTRAKPTRMTVCDLCDKEISDTEPGEIGSLTHGWLAHQVVVGDRPTGWQKTLHAWLQWPPAGRERRVSLERRLADPEQYRQRRYDFHAECILRVVEKAIVERATSETDESEGE